MTTENNEREFLTPEAAEALLDVHDGHVHSYKNPRLAMLIGADMPIEHVRTMFLQSAPELAGSIAESMGHGVACIHQGNRYFFATKRG